MNEKINCSNLIYHFHFVVRTNGSPIFHQRDNKRGLICKVLKSDRTRALPCGNVNNKFTQLANKNFYMFVLICEFLQSEKAKTQSSHLLQYNTTIHNQTLFKNDIRSLKTHNEMCKFTSYQFQNCNSTHVHELHVCSINVCFTTAIFLLYKYK